MATRFSGPGQPYDGLTKYGRWTGKLKIIEDVLKKPLLWRKPRMVFVNSMSDLFHDAVSNEQIAAIFGIMAAAPQHTFQVLTKRPERMKTWFESLLHDRQWSQCRVNMLSHIDPPRDDYGPQTATNWPLPNVWIGVSAENQATADERIPLLIQIPAAVRFVSVEPMLGPVSLRIGDASSLWDGNPDTTVPKLMESDRRIAALSWVISGCESGPNGRPMDDSWVRRLRNQCQEAGIPFFFKQAVRGGKLIKMPKLDGKVWAEMPT
jgi:protein gp37